jgi:hypothetical protein
MLFFYSGMTRTTTPRPVSCRWALAAWLGYSSWATGPFDIHVQRNGCMRRVGSMRNASEEGWGTHGRWPWDLSMIMYQAAACRAAEPPAHVAHLASGRGLATYSESKLASPAPGTMSVDRPLTVAPLPAA